MSSEKVEAYAESATAMAAEIVKANMALWPSVMRMGWTLPYAMWTPSAVGGGKRRRSAAKSASAIVSAAVPRVIAEGLAPVQRRATANAKRLRRTPR